MRVLALVVYVPCCSIEHFWKYEKSCSKSLQRILNRALGRLDFREAPRLTSRHWKNFASSNFERNTTPTMTFRKVYSKFFAYHIIVKFILTLVSKKKEKDIHNLHFCIFPSEEMPKGKLLMSCSFSTNWFRFWLAKSSNWDHYYVHKTSLINASRLKREKRDQDTMHSFF